VGYLKKEEKMGSIHDCSRLVSGLAVSAVLAFAILNLSKIACADDFNFQTDTSLGNCASISAAHPTRTCTTSGGLVISGTQDLEIQNFRGVEGLGLTGPVAGEVSQNQLLSLTIPHQTVTSIEFDRLFGTSSGDRDQESVTVHTDKPNVFGTLTVNSGDMTATWAATVGSLSFTMLAVSLDPSRRPNGSLGAGWYGINDPFGPTLPISDLLAAPGPNVDGATNDFALVGATVAPEPNALLLVATGLIGLLAITWKRFQAT
jgi:hypothetical protein